MVGNIGGDYSAVSALKGASASQTAGTSAANVQTSDSSASGEAGQVQSKVYPKEQVEKVVSSMNDFLKASPNTHLKFEYHDQLNEYYVTIVDENTNEIVREIPPKKMLDMFAAMTEFIGLMVDKKI